MAAGETKTCIVCGRTIEWRKKWERDWDNVRYCSKACRKRGTGDHDEKLERLILELLSKREGGASICPSEVAKLAEPEHWREQIEPVRMAARRLVDRGSVVITQKGHVIDPSTAKGPIRIRKA